MNIADKAFELAAKSPYEPAEWLYLLEVLKALDFGDRETELVIKAAFHVGPWTLGRALLSEAQK